MVGRVLEELRRLLEDVFTFLAALLLSAPSTPSTSYSTVASPADSRRPNSPRRRRGSGSSSSGLGSVLGLNDSGSWTAGGGGSGASARPGRPQRARRRAVRPRTARARTTLVLERLVLERRRRTGLGVRHGMQLGGGLEMLVPLDVLVADEVVLVRGRSERQLALGRLHGSPPHGPERLALGCVPPRPGRLRAGA